MVFPHNRSTVNDDIVREIYSCRIVEPGALVPMTNLEERTGGVAVQVRRRAREVSRGGVGSDVSKTVRRIPLILVCVLDALAEEEWIGDARRPASNRMAIGIQYWHSVNIRYRRSQNSTEGCLKAPDRHERLPARAGPMDGYEVEILPRALCASPRRRRTTGELVAIREQGPRTFGPRWLELRLVRTAQHGGADLQVISRRAEALSIRRGSKWGYHWRRADKTSRRYQGTPAMPR